MFLSDRVLFEFIKRKSSVPLWNRVHRKKLVILLIVRNYSPCTYSENPLTLSQVPTFPFVGQSTIYHPICTDFKLLHHLY